jgi:hypothetical protein
MSYLTTDQFTKIAQDFKSQGGDPVDLLNELETQGHKIQGYNDTDNSMSTIQQPQQPIQPTQQKEQFLPLEEQEKFTTTLKDYGQGALDYLKKPGNWLQGAKDVMKVEDKLIRKPAGEINRSIARKFNPVSQYYELTGQPEQQPSWTRIPEEFAGVMGETLTPTPSDFALGGAVSKVVGGVSKVGKGALNLINKPFKKQIDKEVIDIAAKEGIDLPVGAQTESGFIQTAEALSSKGLFGFLEQNKFKKAMESIKSLENKAVEKAGNIQASTVLGKNASESVEKYKQVFNKAIDSLYSRIDDKVLKSTPINTMKTEMLLDNYIKDAEASIKGGGVTAESALNFYKNISNKLKGSPVTTTGKLVNERGVPLLTKTEKNLPTAYDARESVKQFNKSYKDALIVTGDSAKLNKLRNTLNEDLQESLKVIAPNEYNKIKIANSAFKTKLDLIDTKFNNSIKKMADNGKYENIVDLIKSGSVQDISTLKNALISTGNKKHIGNLQASLLDDVFKNAASKPQGISNQLKKYGETANELFSPEQITSLNEIDKLYKSMGRVSKITGGSQTGFINRVLQILSPKTMAAEVLGHFFLNNKTAQKILLEGYAKGQYSNYSKVIPYITKRILEDKNKNKE